ncbi:MAG: hypothetical protein WAO67_16385, partial [Yoonia sp.]
MIKGIPYGWDTHQVSVTTFAVLLLPLTTAAILRGPTMTLPIGVALGLGLMWSFLFSALRKSAFNWHSPISA